MIGGAVRIPHLNIRGVVENSNGEVIFIKLSDKSQSFLNTQYIGVITSDAKTQLQKNDIVFVKFKDIYITNNQLNFSNIEIYKYAESIEKHDVNDVTWWAVNAFGGFIRYTGKEFSYNGLRYVDYDQDISEDGKYYFIDICDGQLLFEEYKNIFPPMKWFNMVNPQETMFDIILDIYKKEK
jgi:hypothetical protein